MSAVQKRERNGSFMSDRQVGRAAVRQMKMVFRMDARTVSGYVVGMDDFHWLVAQPQGEGCHLSLVHKTCPVVDFTDFALSNEGGAAQDAIREVGQSFWSRCSEKYLGKNSPKETQK